MSKCKRYSQVVVYRGSGMPWVSKSYPVSVASSLLDALCSLFADDPSVIIAMRSSPAPAASERDLGGIFV